jgi:dolichol-phosphate mannosyltransferase
MRNESTTATCASCVGSEAQDCLRMSRNGSCEVTVIIPTFCEAENLPLLVPRIAFALNGAGISYEILVVDDNSQDGTHQACIELATTYPVHLEIRTHKRGLSSAVVDGMEIANGSILVVMDADLSHPPEKIPELVRLIQMEEADFAIGSRYAPGGATDENWGLFRWINSKVATVLAWPLTRIHDPMAGFFALRRTTFEACARLDPIGYKIALELLVKSGCRKIKETPITFHDRVHGASKLTVKEQANYLRHLGRLYAFRFGQWRQPLQFIFVGSTGVVVDLCVFSLALLVIPEHLARAVAIWVAMTWNFLLNRNSTFHGFAKRNVAHQYLLFCLSSAIGVIISWTIFVTLSLCFSLFSERPLLAALLGISGGSTINYLTSKYMTFK